MRNMAGPATAFTLKSIDLKKNCLQLTGQIDILLVFNE